MSKIELYDKISENLGVNVSALPDRLESTFLAAILAKMGGNPDELPDRLPCTFLSAIAECCGSGSSGGGDASGSGSGNIIQNVVWSDSTSTSDQASGSLVGNGIIRYVTFMNHDGTVEYGRKSVIAGEDCVDPVDSKLMDTPTRESTAQYNYTFSGGWATVPNGGKDANALKAVNEDRTVYANFIASVRYYAITFYDSDGTTVLTTKSVAYGSVPSYTPTKDGYDHSGWIPEPVAVTGPASYTAVWEEKPTFETATWEKIAEVCAAGNHASTFAIGDSKPVTLTYADGTSETIRFTIVDMDVDPVSDTEKAALTLMADNIVAISPTKLASKYNGHNNMLYRMDTASAFLNKVFSALPADLQSVIKPNVYYPMLSWSTKIFVPHTVNLGLAPADEHTGDPIPYNGKYKYFANGASVKRTKLTDASMDNYWTANCTKSISQGSYTSYYYAAVDGTSVMTDRQNPDDASHGIVPCFCI